MSRGWPRRQGVCFAYTLLPHRREKLVGARHENRLLIATHAPQESGGEVTALPTQTPALRPGLHGEIFALGGGVERVVPVDVMTGRTLIVLAALALALIPPQGPGVS